MANVTPNHYTLRNSRVQLNYSTNGFQGHPHFSYDDGQQVLNFQGPQIRVTNTEIGQLVSVTIKESVDSESVSYTVLFPVVALHNNQEQAKIQSEGITTLHRTALVQPPTGQRETYRVEKLEGLARVAMFAAGGA